MATATELVNSANTKRKLESEFDDETSPGSKSENKLFKLGLNSFLYLLFYLTFEFSDDFKSITC